MILWKAICSNCSSGINDVGVSGELWAVELIVVDSVVSLCVLPGWSGEAVDVCAARSVTSEGDGGAVIFTISAEPLMMKVVENTFNMSMHTEWFLTTSTTLSPCTDLGLLHIMLMSLESLKVLSHVMRGQMLGLQSQALPARLMVVSEVHAATASTGTLLSLFDSRFSICKFGMHWKTAGSKIWISFPERSSL